VVIIITLNNTNPNHVEMQAHPSKKAVTVKAERKTPKAIQSRISKCYRIDTVLNGTEKLV
jgi:hypothetical protein